MKRPQTLREMVMEKFGAAQQIVDRNEDLQPQQPQQVKVASGRQDVVKLAEAVEKIAVYIAKKAEEESSAGPGKGPNTLETQTLPSAGGPLITGNPAKNSDDKVPLAPGTEDGTAIATDYTDPVGEGAGITLPPKVADFVAGIRRLYKRALEEESSAGPGKGPGTLDTSLKSDPEVPTDGKVLQDTQDVIDMKASDAEKIVQDQMKGILDEKPVPAAETPLATDTFETAKQSSRQAVAARVYLQKIADRGCTCNGAGTCDFCRMTAALNNPGSAGAAIKH